MDGAVTGGTTEALSEQYAADWIAANGFTSTGAGKIGVELEWLCRPVVRPDRRPSADTLQRVMADLPAVLPGGGRISLEPGGQVELSSAPHGSLAQCVTATAGDLALTRSVFTEHGIRLDGAGLDRRPPRRVADLPRYAALEAHYDRFGPSGRVMMCNTASVQISLDVGDDSDSWLGYARRWHLANRLGPVLVAAFANSPDPEHGWCSMRQVLRFRTDPTRTEPLPPHENPKTAWSAYVLDAYVVGIHDDRRAAWLRPADLTMRRWLRGEGPRPVYLEDLRRHVKTVIPPVRPRGTLEFRMIDAQPGDGWVVPVAVVSALMDDPVAAGAAADTLAAVGVRDDLPGWLRAAQAGLGADELRQAASACFAIALTSLRRSTAPAGLADDVARYLERYVSCGPLPGR